MADFRGNRQSRVRGGSVVWDTQQAATLLLAEIFPASGGTVSGISLTGGQFASALVGAGDSQLVLNAGLFYFRVPTGGDLTVSESSGLFAAA